MIELLAPAKNKECAIAAINYGADAVYIGANEFGARKNAPNSLEDIKEITDYAHKFNAKVYVTLNIILKDNELAEAKKLIKNLKNMGVDALIVQDMALVKIAKELDMCIHASTQCDNRTTEKVKFLQDVGFSRVVLARELSLEQIREIKSKTNVELETFIHGALCVSYSGQCYLSYLIGGRSANRGECAQPCRKKYSLVDAKGKTLAKDKYLLCLKDFNASEHIKELAEVGVLSFKIEGRLKDVDYVKNVVAFYRKLIDDLKIKKTSDGHINFDFEPKLEKSFNRGFTDYFLEKRKDCYNFDSPKSKGEYLGKVSKVGKDFFEISGNIELSPQDGLCFFEKENFSGCLVNKVENVMLNSFHYRNDNQIKYPEKSSGQSNFQRIYPNRMPNITVGTKIYRNFDAKFEKQLNNSKTARKIFADVIFDFQKVIAVDENNNQAEVNFSFEEIANNREKMVSNIENQFKKSGESLFEIKSVEIKAKEVPFLPVSKLNELRRNLLDNLEKNRKINFEKKFNNSFSKNKNEKAIYPEHELDYKGNVFNKQAQNFYEEHGVKILESAIESGRAKSGMINAMTTKHCIRYALNMCKKDKNTENSDDELFLEDEKGKKYKLEFDCKNCEMHVFFIK